ncbi:hypothetical protein [Methylocapsa sp. S129]|uniref:hypothetical protein n=1 Tax=Methylocapsa sp. S129 TaxID=1641869 RepID=UPI00131A8F3E|nr:hypothetical protein [Methylocapsa sp. S129]
MAKSPIQEAGSAVRLVVVSNYEQLQHAFAIRSICFMEDTGLSVKRAFDGNDFQATHIVAYARDEPIGATRIRWFRDFAKIERTGFRKAYRSAQVLKQCSAFVFDHAARKGYTQVLTVARRDFAGVWIRVLGFRELAHRAIIREGEPFLTLVKNLTAPQQAISIETDSNVLMRIEGAWDVATPFEGESR